MIQQVNTPTSQYTLASCLKVASRYLTKTEWKFHDLKSYDSAMELGVLQECCKHMKCVSTELSEEDCKRIALLFNSRTEWGCADRNSWQLAGRLGIRDECSKHMEGESLKGVMYTRSQCIDVAKEHTTMTSWRTSDSQSYRDASKYNILDECSRHMVKKACDNWSKEGCINSALRAKTPSNWDLIDRAAFIVAVDNCWLSECLKKMDASPSFWTQYLCVTASRPFKTEEEWMEHCPLSYTAAKKNLWLDKCPPTMKKKVVLESKIPLEKWLKDRYDRKMEIQGMGIKIAE